MKLISLNTWGGRLKEPFDDFIRRHAPDTDVFCFQEVYTNGSSEANVEEGERPSLFEDLQAMLSDFTCYFAEQTDGTGLAPFVREGIEVASSQSFATLTSEDLQHLSVPQNVAAKGVFRYYPRNLQTVKLEEPHVAICNFHGIPGGDKQDSLEREKQTEKLLEALGSIDGPKLLVGDFNLNPDTESLRIVGEGMRNLVKEGGYTTTRSRHYHKLATSPFADYTFVTPGVSVTRFEVLPDEVSDHLAMLLEFE